MFEELEYKYRADHVRINDFKKLMELVQPKAVYKNPASWDVYYMQESDDSSFQRLRKSPDGWELTKKVKTKDSNNWVRLESDLPLDPVKASEKVVSFHVGLDGYKENFRIFKYCDIYVFEEINYVYYIVFDENLKELGRFIEVEVNKPWLYAGGVPRTPTEAMEALRKGEILLQQLNISAQNRLKKSLFELFRKGNP
jgi:adenylate cyclase class IV